MFISKNIFKDLHTCPNTSSNTFLIDSNQTTFFTNKLGEHRFRPWNTILFITYTCSWSEAKIGRTIINSTFKALLTLIVIVTVSFIFFAWIFCSAKLFISINWFTTAIDIWTKTEICRAICATFKANLTFIVIITVTFVLFTWIVYREVYFCPCSSFY